MQGNARFTGKCKQRLALWGAASLLLLAAAPAALADVKYCAKLAPRLPGVSQQMCETSALAPSGGRSRNGFPILIRHITHTQGSSMRVLFLGGIHGDEMTASSAVFRWMPMMNGPDAPHIAWDVVPVVNPDGLLAPRAQRMNANGVDLNRNFPTANWKVAATQYWIRTTRRDPRRFPGARPLSEPESRWVHEEIRRFQPQLIVSVHAPFGVLDLDGPAEPPQRFGRLLYNRIGVYPGSLGLYGGSELKVPILTIELPDAKRLPSDEEMQRIWRDMLAWIDQNVPNKDVAAGQAHKVAR